MVTVCPSQFATRRTLFHVLVGCGLLMLKVSRLKLPVIRSEERFSRNAETDLVCRLLLEKKKNPPPSRQQRLAQALGRELYSAFDVQPPHDLQLDKMPWLAA